MNGLKVLCSVRPIRTSLTKMLNPTGRGLATQAFGLSFKNPVGLAAGFDKNAHYLRELEVLGFAFVEIGTVTPKPQEGNEQPRLFRLTKDKALINRMGFNNDGVEIIKARLEKWREQNTSPSSDTKVSNLIIGGNIGKNKSTPNEEAWKDYEICFLALHPYVDFFVVNVSSPNTPGLRALQEKESLQKILTHLQQLNRRFSTQRPILLKIAPDLSEAQLDDVVKLAKEIDLDGIVASNTTISRDGLRTGTQKLNKIGNGGLSGKPLAARATEVVHYVATKTVGRIPVIGSGGIFNGADGAKMISAGASLIEVWTGFIYEGPLIVKRICKHLQSQKT